MSDGYEVIGGEPPRKARPVAKPVARAQPAADGEAGGYGLVDEPLAKRPEPVVSRHPTRREVDEDDESDLPADYHTLGRRQEKARRAAVAAGKAEPPNLLPARAGGAALIVAGLVLVAVFAKFGVGVRSIKVFAGLGAGGPAALVLGAGLLLQPLPLAFLMRLKDAKKPGVGKELWDDLPGFWKAWLGLVGVVAVASLAVAFLLVAPGRR